MISDLPKSILRLLKYSAFVFHDFRSAEVYPAPVKEFTFVFHDFRSAEVYPAPVKELGVL